MFLRLKSFLPHFLWLLFYFFWKKCDSVHIISFIVIFAIQDSICYIDIQMLCTLQNNHFTNINNTYVRSREISSKYELIHYLCFWFDSNAYKELVHFATKLTASIFFFCFVLIHTMIWLVFKDIRGVLGWIKFL